MSDTRWEKTGLLNSRNKVQGTIEKVFRTEPGAKIPDANECKKHISPGVDHVRAYSCRNNNRRRLVEVSKGVYVIDGLTREGGRLVVV